MRSNEIDKAYCPEDILSNEKLYKEIIQEENRLQEKNQKAIDQVKQLIAYPWEYISEHLEELGWEDDGFCEVEFLSSIPIVYSQIAEGHYHIKGQPDKIFSKYKEGNGLFYYLVYQRQYADDLYGGWLLFPLKNGQYWKVGYST